MGAVWDLPVSVHCESGPILRDVGWIGLLYLLGRLQMAPTLSMFFIFQRQNHLPEVKID